MIIDDGYDEDRDADGDDEFMLDPVLDVSKIWIRAEYNRESMDMEILRACVLLHVAIFVLLTISFKACRFSYWAHS